MNIAESGRARQQYKIQDGRCCWCGNPFPLSKLTRDHAIPRSLGGSTDWDNIVLACERCNSRRGDSLPDKPLEFAMVKP